MLKLAIASTACILTSSAFGEIADAELRDHVTKAMRKAAVFYRSKVARHGGYVYHCSIDLKLRLGEGVATEDQIWVQPPGTPTVGMAYLRAYEATKDSYYLDAGREAAEALVFGQLRGGGWTNAIDLKLRRTGAKYSGGPRRREGNCSLDDGQSQSAILMLIRADESLGFKHKEIHEATKFALRSLLAAQFPNGGFPQVWRGPVKKQPIVKASYPDYDWRTEHRVKNYWDYYTLNDNVCGYVIDTLLEAHRVYREDKYMASARRLGDFLLLARMPEPQPAWAQQYNYEMKPIWARKFEPPAVSGDESQEVVETLMKIFEATGDSKYLEPVPRALAFLRKSLLPDGRLARYYELKTNRPLYMARKSKKVYKLTYDDSRLPGHYGWKTESKLDELERAYNSLKSGRSSKKAMTSELKAEVQNILKSLDNQGRWISIYRGERLIGQAKFKLNTPYLASSVFSQKLETLSSYLMGTR
ncbi:MAG: pectate lyase [Planctomycetota bacterium]|nr:pectate lyase [Planctomycetota bacterium]